ncbi:hypothetical protein PsalMR5_03723 [Piscirickettsia salmonis]|uniref:hypothetical protein n=1 Tax=Piscirickettsia salmonis TaxID=1238 RepID=UPI0012BAAD56|nr:hypothetical protein [Piscirickettsia salmonis]QGP56242.1 hypothetical protein PsalSR1_03719 [Piscirickettsia salmonis]QGP57887.1 hypothetical protein PsalBI1_00433 [Piscirickettsia salmonis]QGP65810.1 hypothetical protein PsalMR5_03723 [Piscirickettsia salmonis]
MLKKNKSTSFVIGLALSFSFACYANALTEAEFKATKLPYSVMAYSNQYAHEYGLDASKAIDLPKGLEAVKLILSKDFSKGYGPYASKWEYNCSAELYVDKSLNLYWPGNYSKVDKVGDGGLQKAQISTVQLKRKGEYWVPGPYASMLYDSYDQTIKLNLAKINLSFFGCNYVPSRYTAVKDGLAIWLERKGGHNYAAIGQGEAEISSKDFYIFKLPQTLRAMEC